MSAFLTSILGLPKWVKIGAGVIVILAAAALWLTAHDRNQQDIGATRQREADLTRTIENVDKANKAAERVRSDPDAARDDCLRHARNPADC